MSNIWNGHITFGLVSMPVRLEVAARSESIGFNQLYRTEDGSLARVKMPVCDQENKPISRENVLKGFEYSKNQYIVIDKQELEAAAPKTAQAMEILECVPASEIDPVFLETSYYVVPEDSGKKAYALIYAALKKSGKVAIAKVAMHNREHIVILRAASKGITAHTMFYRDEVRSANECAADLGLISDQELTMAGMLIDQKSAAFAPEKYRDDYRINVQQIIDKKVAAQPTFVASPAASNVIDIQEALKLSLEKKPAAAVESKRRKKSAVN